LRKLASSKVTMPSGVAQIGTPHFEYVARLQWFDSRALDAAFAVFGC
jgi:hypothetical protein